MYRSVRGDPPQSQGSCSRCKAAVEIAEYQLKGTLGTFGFQAASRHLVLLDIHLPDFDDYEVVRRIRTHWPPIREKWY